MLVKDFLWNLILDFRILKLKPKIFFRNFLSDSKMLAKDFLRNFCFNFQNYININFFCTQQYPMSNHSFSSFTFRYHDVDSFFTIFRIDISNNSLDSSSIPHLYWSSIDQFYRFESAIATSLKHVWT